MDPPTAVAPERVRELFDTDLRRILRFAPFALGGVLAFEAISHLGGGEAVFVVPPALGAIASFAIGARVRAFEDRGYRPGPWAVAQWTLMAIPIGLHLPGAPGGSIAFASMMLLLVGALILPLRAMILTGALSWGMLVTAALLATPEGGTSLAQTLPFTFAAPALAGIAHVARRSSILNAERHRTLALQLQAEQERVRHLERLEAMAGGFVHHLNNQLTAVMLGATLAADQLVDRPEARESLDEVLEGTERATRLLRRLASVAGDSGAAFVTLPAATWIDEAALRNAAPNHAVTVERESDLPPIRGVPDQLGELLVALVENAADASADGAPITVRVAASEAPAGLRIAVEDTGAGIPAEVEPLAWEPFFTTREPTREGLGLAVALGIANRHRGSISIDSKPGEGTRVQVWIPAA